MISANLAQNRVRLIHGVNLYMSLYGNLIIFYSILCMNVHGAYNYNLLLMNTT